MAETTSAPSRAMSRWQASGIHLLISAAIAAVSLFLMLGVWYPSPFFKAEGGTDLLFILIGVDVVIGPLITLIIFKSGKPNLCFDLTVIGLLQAAALSYGTHVMFEARPVYVAFVDDTFETVRANDLDSADVAQATRPEFRSVPLGGPVFVATDMPKNIKALRELVAQMQKSGGVVQHFPKFYVPYSDYRTRALEKGRPIEELVKNDRGLTERVGQLLQQSGRKAADLKFIPLQTRRGWGAVFLDGKTGDVVAILPPAS